MLELDKHSVVFLLLLSPPGREGVPSQRESQAPPCIPAPRAPQAAPVPPPSPPPASAHARWQPVSGRYLFLHYCLALFYLLSKPSSIYSLASALVVYISLLCLLCHLLKWELGVLGPLRPFPYINLNHTRCGPLLQRKTNWFRQSQYAYCFLTQINTVVWGAWGWFFLLFFLFFSPLPQVPKVIQLKDSRKCD